MQVGCYFASAAVLLLAIVPYAYQPASAECAVSAWGIGGDTATPMYDPAPQKVGGRQLDVDIRQAQDLFGGDYFGDTRSITFRLCSIDGDNTIPNVTYRISVTGEDGSTVLDDTFYSGAGILDLKISNSSETRVVPGTKQDPGLNSALVADSNGTVPLQSPFMWEPGSYYLTVKVLGYGTKGIAYGENAPSFVYTTGIPDMIRPDILHGNSTYAAKILSSEKIHDFVYDPDSVKLSWSTQIPRDYALNPARQIFWHIEIPKSFYDFSRSPFLNATVNGNPIPYSYASTQSSDDSISADLVFPNSLLSKIAEGQNSRMVTITSSVSPVSKSSQRVELSHGIDALISWMPDPPTANGNSTANIQFLANGTLLKNVVYDLDVYHKPGTYLKSIDYAVAKDGTDSERIFLPQNDVYQIYLHVRGLYSPSMSNSLDATLDGDGYGYIVTQDGTHPPITAERVTKVISLNDLRKMMAAQHGHAGDWQNSTHLQGLAWSSDDKSIVIQTENGTSGTALWSINLDGTGLHSMLQNGPVASVMQENQSRSGSMVVFLSNSPDPAHAHDVMIGTRDGTYRQVLYAADTSTEFPAISHDGMHVVFAFEASSSSDRPLEDGIYILTPSTAIPEFPLAVPVLMLGISSLVAFYRINHWNRQ